MQKSSVSSGLLWGRDQGCDFVEKRCVGAPGGTLFGFCAESSAEGCTPGHRAQGYCDLSTYGSALPSEYQYFADPTLGESAARSG